MCAATAGLILVLITGTDFFSWHWILAAAAAGLAVAAWRLPRQIPSPYSVAQAIDRRLDLKDSLSTAWFYSRGGRKASDDVVRAQTAQADALASDVAVEKAVPYAAPRSLYAMAALGLAATGLIAIRYGITHRLDLKGPLPAMVLDIFQFSAKAQPITKNDPLDRRTRDMLNEYGVSLEREQARDAEGQHNAPAAEAAEAEHSERGEPGKPAGEASIAQDQQSQDEQRESMDAPGIPIPQAGDERGQEGQERPGAGERASNGKQGQNNSGENSLMNKFRDALANLMSRMKPQSGAQQTAGAQMQKDSGQGRESQGQQGMERASRGDPRGMPGSQGKGDQEGEGSDQVAQGGGQKSSGSDSNDQREGRSGIGKDDGDKSIKEAEQLAAMGKISEIVGKRSQSLTGEVMVEVTSGDQKLKTAYSRQSAEHAEAGGEIHRDEVPLAYHRFVQQYFEEIRKTPPPPKEPGAHAAKQ